MTNTKIVIGLDFGTTNSTACYIDTQSGQSQLVTDISGFTQYASMLSFSKDKNGNLCQFGYTVKNNPSLTGVIQEVKRFIGKDFIDMEEMAEKLGMNIEEGKNKECIFVIPDPENEEEELRFTAEELVAIQLRHIKEIILQRCEKADFNKVVMTVPSSYTQKQVETIKMAYKLAGIDPLTIMREPSAAVYQFNQIQKDKKISRAMVIDIGGGTTDVCICEANGDNSTVRGNVGDPMLGGSDFDAIMMNMILEELENQGYEKMYLFRKENGEVKQMKKERMKYTNKLKQEAERAKIHLSTRDIYQVSLEKVLPRGDDDNFDIQISRADFEEKIKEEELVERIEDCIKDSLKKANIRASQVEKVLLIGGISMMPIVRQMVEKKFGKDKIAQVTENNFAITAVVKGAARYAQNYAGTSESKETKDEQFETLPDSIGIEVRGGEMKFIAKEGERTPIKNWEHEFETLFDNQDTINFSLYKGDEKYTMDNEYIDQFSVKNLPPKPKGEVKVKLMIDIEKSGNMIMKAKRSDDNQEAQTLNVSCRFSKSEEEHQESLDKISPFCPN